MTDYFRRQRERESEKGKGKPLIQNRSVNTGEGTKEGSRPNTTKKNLASKMAQQHVAHIRTA